MYALVTGASSGIGKEIAIELAARNYNLILTARREERLYQLKEELEKSYPIQVIVKPIDLSIEGNCQTLFQECREYEMGVLVNNAGFGKVGRITSIGLDDEIRMIQTNITALHTLTKLFIKKSKKGYILNVASMAAYQPTPMMAAYGSTKSYVLSFTRAVNYEMKKYRRNIHLTALCPGPVDTEFNKVAHADFALPSISAAQCAKAAVDGLFKRKEVIIPSSSMKLLHMLSKFTPTHFILPVQYEIQMRKKRKQ